MHNPTVNIAVTTYNQENYIANTLDSLLMQQTNFDFVIVIGEDCSTDNTLQIVQKYKAKNPTKIRLLNSDKNHGSALNLLRTIKACNAKYIAICDGDDYWIEPLKLQKQVDFLDKNTSYGTVATLRKDFIEVENLFKNTTENFSESYKTIDFTTFLFKNHFTASTVLFQKELMDKFIAFYQVQKNISFNDYNFFLFFAYHKKVAKLNIVTTVYRILPESGSHSKDAVKVWDFRKRFYHAIKLFLDYFKVDNSLKNKVLHYRAITDYIIVSNSKDTLTCNEFLQIFKTNKDYIRYFLLKKGMQNIIWNRIALFLEKLNLKLGGYLLKKA